MPAAITAVGNARIRSPGIQTEAFRLRKQKKQRSFSGGDPLHPSNISTVTAFAKKIREKYPNKTIWLYTGSLWEEICNEEIVQYLDVCVDGEFQIDKRDTSLRWKGSSNQRVIDVPSTLREGKVVLHCDN